MDIIYKFLVEDNVAKIKDSVFTREIADDLYQHHLIDPNQYSDFGKLTNEEGLDILLQCLSRHDKAGNKYKQFVEDVIHDRYAGLYIFLQEKLTDNGWINDKYRDRLNFGDFPRRPAHYVERSDKIRQVQDCLKKLSTIGKVILCGMTGSGKTSLVIGVMTREMVLEVFAGNVFWITVGDVDDEQLLMLLWRFYLKLSDENMQENNVFASKDVLKDKLKKKIREYSTYSRMLLVLDNVCSRKAIETFDIGCKVLVTTQNKDIWKDDQDSALIEVDGSFKFDETCHLFAKCLQESVSYVQQIDEVQTIHDLCQGHPFSIALFGSQIATYRDKLLDKHSKMWKSLIKMLQKNYANQQNTVISSCIEILDEELRSKFSDFAIFPNDVNISSKVLQIMWGLEEVQVIDVMRKFENKSLIVSYYNYDQHNYIYGIHVVLLTYLKNRYRHELKEKHQRLISAYKDSCKGDFSRLTNDNYIYQYIGYHLKRAELIQDFKAYFDLRFIGAKIKATGIGDVLKDFNLYRKEIEGHTYTNNKDIVNELEAFVKKFGDDMHKYEDMSIVQCGLKYAEDTFIYKAAMEIATNSPSSLYFKINVSSKTCDNHIAEFNLPENCTFVCFAKDEQQLLIGTKEGVIELWDRIYRKVTCKFIGHTLDIKYIELDPERTSFLSVSDDGSVNLWKLRLHKIDSNPSLVQSNHRPFFGEETTYTPSDTFKPEENDCFVSATFCNDYPNDSSIAMGTIKGGIFLYKDGNRKNIHLNKGEPIENLRFSDDDTLIVGTCGNELFFWTSNLADSVFETVDKAIIAVLAMEDKFFTLHDTSVYLWTFVTNRMPGDQLPRLKGTRIAVSATDHMFTCAFVDDNILYVVTTDHKVIFFNVTANQKMKIVSLFDNEITDCITAADVCFSHSEEPLFLLKYSNNILKFHTPRTLMHTGGKHKPIFDSYWTDQHVRLVSVTPNNSIQISNRFNILNELNDVEKAVTAVLFSPDGDSVAYGLENGEILEYEIKTNHRNTIMRMPSSVLLLRNFDRKTLVAASKKGDLIMRRDERNVCLITKSEFSKIATEPIVEIFYLNASDSLLTVSRDRGIKSWYLGKSRMQVQRGPKESYVTHTVQMATMSKDKKLLALTLSNMFDLFLIESNDDGVKLIDFGGVQGVHELHSCAFSHDGKYLAVGSVDGVIIIYQINLSANTSYEYARLHSHVSMVRCLKFAPHHSNLLVSVGEQVVWWNLDKVPKSSISRNRRSRRNRPNNDLVTMTDALVLPHQMCEKIGSESKPHLLRAIKLKGSYANSISASPNFKSFVTKDNEGVNYIIDMIG